MAGILERLVLEKGLVDAESLDEAKELSRQNRESLFDTIVSRGYADEDLVLSAFAEYQRVSFVNLKETPIDAAAVQSVSARFVSHYKVMPVAVDGGIITLAISNPLDLSAVEDIETNLGLRVERVYAAADDIAQAIRKHYGVGADTVERILDDYDRSEAVIVERESHDLEKMAEDASVIKLVNQILQQAINDRATDIHFEQYDNDVTVRRRIDGVLYDTKVADNIAVLYPAIISRIKLVSGMNIVEKRLPQDGRVRVTIGHKQYDLRISVIPAMHGENVVVRILPTTMLLSMDDLGLSKENHETVDELIKEPHGIIFVTGPTGSGKSTTLYACLSQLNTRDRKIITIEDPIEYEVKGISQTQINSSIGLTFSRALRSMLRHDPDVMMVGEVRDKETAEITIQTALTGHLVFSTLHTNDAAGGPIRLMDMGIPPYLVASSVRAFTAQRLVRVICSGCRESYEADGRELFRGKGCQKCGRTGYLGRVAICEILKIKDEIRALITERADASEIARAGVSLGMTPLAEDGWNKVAQGVTTAEEVLRVTSL